MLEKIQTTDLREVRVRHARKKGKDCRMAIQQCSLFKNTPETVLEQVLLESQIHDFDKATLIFDQKDKADRLFVVFSGKVKLFRQRKGSEKQEIVCLIQAGGYFCLAPLISREKFHISAETIESSQILIIPRASLITLINNSIEFAKNVIQALALKECELCEEVCDLSLTTTKERLAKFILKELENQKRKKSIKISYNQSQIASFIGTTRENLARDMSALKKAKIIVTANTEWRILDLEGLKNLAAKN